ncbi:MAG: hypothetical protein Q7K33_02640 [Candidatus Berkelbacteria bacterium]|nr:hypothetical protein [Candidatus Berkelbacteria bacterium]
MKTKPIRIIERQIYKWPKVRRQVDGDRTSYYAGPRQFAFIEKDLLVLIRTTPDERKALSAEWGAGPYESAYGKTIGFYLQVPLDETNAEQLLPYIRNSYQHALTWKGV